MGTAYEKLVEKLGEAGAREEMKRRAARSSRNTQGTGYFAQLAKTEEGREKLKELGRTYGRKKNDGSSI